MPQGIGYGGGNVIDLRGSPTGIEELGAGLASLLGALSTDPKDKIRAALIENPDMGRQAALAWRQWERNRETTDQPGKFASMEVPQMPGGGIIPPEVMQEMSMLFPATRDEEVQAALGKIVTPEQEAQVKARPTQVATEFGRQVSPTEEAGAAATELRSGTTQATLAGRKAQRELDMIGAMERAGFTAEQEGEINAGRAVLEIAKMNLEAAGVELDQQGLDNFAKMYATSNAQDRAIMTAGLAGPRGHLFGQALLNRESYDRERNLSEFRARLASMKSPEEVLEAQFELKTKIRNERDRLIAQLEDAPKDQLPGLIEDIKDVAADLLRVDPAAVAQIVRGDPGWVGTEIEKVKFDITDITKERSDMLEVGAHMLAQENMSDASINNLRKSLTDGRTGVVNERVFMAIMERANQIKSSNDAKLAADSASAAAEQAWIDHVTRPNAPVVAEKNTQTLEQKLSEAIEGSASPREIAALMAEVQKQRQYQFFLSGGPPRVRLDTPPVARRTAPGAR